MEPLLNLTARELRSRLTAEYPFHGDNHISFAMPDTPAPTDPKLVLGRRIYYNACVYCHGVEGIGQGFLVCPKSPLRGKTLSLAEIKYRIKKPSFPMPLMRMLPVEEEALAAYVFELEKSTAPMPSPVPWTATAAATAAPTDASPDAAASSIGR